MKSRILAILSFVGLLFSAGNLLAGGSGLNVLVVVNQNSSNSVQLGNYYCEQRGVPPQNLLRITNWSGGFTTWDKTNYESVLHNPLQTAIASRGLTNQIDYVLLSMDFPYAISTPGGYNSTTAALFYGFKFDPCLGCSYLVATDSTNQYFASEGIFRQTPPVITGSNAYLVVMLTASNLAQAKQLVDRGVASDGTLPTQPTMLSKSDDVARNIRYLSFDNAIFNTRLRGNYAVLRTNSVTTIGHWTDQTGLTNLLGYQNGLYQFSIAPGAFVPGAMADSLTSYGGLILSANDHTSLLAFINAGAIGSYGTVVEPNAYLEKFPSPQNYFYQLRGFSMAESYYQSLQNPYQGLLVGEPLAAPFALPASGSWTNLTTNSLLSGSTNLALQLIAHDASRPVCRVDLFLDGGFLQTLTNIPPTNGNIVSVSLNGFSTNYTVPASASIRSVTSNLTVKLNGLTNFIKVMAFAHGDRIELRSFDLNTRGSNVVVSVSNSIGTASALTTFIAASRTNLLDTTAYGTRNLAMQNALQVNSYLQLNVVLTNGTAVTVTVTNVPAVANAGALVQALVNAVNTNASLTGSGGVVAEDFISYDVEYASPGGEFNLRARSPGWLEAQIRARLTGATHFTYFPTGTNKLDEPLGDLQPRNHLYLTAGRTNLSFAFAFNSANQPDGYHELTAVVYEGSHVQTQKRITQNVRIQNLPLTATFVSLMGGSNTAVEATLQFSVTANTNSGAISKIELFGTGGLLGSVAGQSNVVFSVAGTNLDLGLHPFYAIVTRTDGKQYRTDTKWIRLVAASPPFSLTLTNPPPVIRWPAIAGRSYDVLSTTNITGTFQLRTTLIPTNSYGWWRETNTIPSKQFYRVRVSP